MNTATNNIPGNFSNHSATLTSWRLARGWQAVATVNVSADVVRTYVHKGVKATAAEATLIAEAAFKALKGFDRSDIAARFAESSMWTLSNEYRFAPEATAKAAELRLDSTGGWLSIGA